MKLFGRPLAAWFTFWALCLLISDAVAKYEWKYGKSENFEVLTSINESETQKLIGDLERFHQTLIRSLKLNPVHSFRPLVILFKNKKGFQEYAPRYKGKALDVAGYFHRTEDQCVIAMNLEEGAGEASRVIYHEYLHLLHYRSGGITPPTWLDEGEAELFSTFDVKGNVGLIGAGIPWHLYLLQHERLMPLERLFSVNTTSPEYNEKSKQGLFYAESWALTQYLLCGKVPGQREKFFRYLELLSNSTTPTEENFKAAFGVDYKTMLERLDQYIVEGKYRLLPLALPEKDWKNVISLSAASEMEIEFSLATLLLHSDRGAEAAPRLLRLKVTEPESPRSHEALGILALQEKDFERARSEYEEAVALKSEGFFSYYITAEFLIQDALTGVSLFEDMNPYAVNRTRELLLESIRLNPSYGLAYERLALVEAHAAPPNNFNVNLIQHHLPFIHEQGSTMLNLALSHRRIADYKTVTVILNEFANGRIPLPANSENEYAQLKKDLESHTAKPPAEVADEKIP